MNPYRISDALSQMEEELIEEYFKEKQACKRKRRISRMARLGGIAACLCLILFGIPGYLSWHGGSAESNAPNLMDPGKENGGSSSVPGGALSSEGFTGINGAEAISESSTGSSSEESGSEDSAGEEDDSGSGDSAGEEDGSGSGDSAGEEDDSGSGDSAGEEDGSGSEDSASEKDGKGRNDSEFK